MMAFNSLKGRAGFKGYQRLKDESHCLANFWVLPMDVGHSSPWTARRGLMYLSKSAKCKDDMGEFLQFAQCNTEAFQKVYPGYTNRLGMREESWDRFLDRHFIAGIDYAIHDPSMFQNALRKRAESIAACEKTREGLAELFQSENYRMIP